jgi:hypothetical protein
MTEHMPPPEAVVEVVERLLSAHQSQDAAAIASALASPVLRVLDQQQPGLSNIHLAFAFARLLSQECPVAARDEKRVPQLHLLVGDGAELPGELEARVTVGQEIGSPVTKAEAKASSARFAEGIPLAQKFMHVWTLSPQAVPDFVHAQAGRSAVMVDAVWGVLFQACATIRAATGRSIP